MTPAELYEALDRAGVDYEIVEIMEGVRIIRVQVWDEQIDMVSENSLTGETE
jgi:glutaredoxin-related protein